MNRGVLLTIVIVLVLAILGVGVVLFWQPGILNTNKTANMTVNVNTAQNKNVNIDLSLADYRADIRDTQTINIDQEYRDAVIPIDRVDVTSGIDFLGPASEGKKYVIVYLKKEELKFSERISNWFAAETQLIDNEGNVYGFARSQFMTVDDQNPSYISFEVNADSSGFTLRFVRDGEDKKVDLGI
jgi:hypothetical protein